MSQTPWNDHHSAFVLRIDVEHREAERYTGDPRTERVATTALLDELALLEVRATCAVLGITAEHYPDIIRRIAEAGHDIAGHSMFHEPAFSAMSILDQRWDHRRTRQTILDACGVQITGIAAHYHGLTNTDTFRSAAAEGFEYLNGKVTEGAEDLPADAPGFASYIPIGAEQSILAPAGRRIGGTDWSARRREWPWIEEPWSAEGARRRWRADVDRARETRAVYTLVIHPWMLHINEGEWAVVRDTIAYARDSGAWFTTYGDLTALAKQRYPG